MDKGNVFYIKADFKSFTEGPLSEAELLDAVNSGDLKRSGKISLDNEQFVSAQRVEDILWPTEKEKARLETIADLEPLYERIYYRINPHKRKRKKVLVTRSLTTLFKNVLHFIRAPKGKRDPQKLRATLREHRKQLITACGLFACFIVVMVTIFYLFPAMAYHSRFKSGTEKLNGKDYRGAIDDFRQALEVSGYKDDPYARDGMKLAKDRMEQKKNQDEFNKLIKEGKKLFADEDFSGAKAKFEEAMALPSFRSDISADEELQKTLSALKEQDKENEKLKKQYVRLIERAEKSYADAKYQSAERAYREAQRISGYETDAKAQAGIEKAEIARDQERTKNTERFKAEIATGDAFRVAGSYSKAADIYKSAMTIPGFDRADEALDGLRKIDDAFAAAAKIYPHLEQNGEAKITDYDAKTGGNVTIPDRLSDLPVTVISDNAFANKKIAKLQISETVKMIGDRAFQGNDIRSVDLPPALITLGESAFANNKLEVVTLPKSLTEYAPSVFENNALKDLVLPQGVVTIGKRAFANNKLEKVKFPDGLKNIAPDAFYGNRNLSTTFPGGSIFTNEGNYELFIREVGQTKRSLIVHFNGQNSGDLKIPAKVGDNPAIDAIGDEAFIGAKFTSVEIPKAIKKIGAKAFAGSPLKSIDLGANVNDIAADAFDDPEFLTFYVNGNKRAGRYNFENGKWIKIKVSTND